MVKTLDKSTYFLIALVMLSLPSLSQSKQSYLYEKIIVDKKTHYFLFEKDTLDITPFIKKGKGVRECTVITGTKKYIDKEVKRKRTSQLLDEQGNVLATVGFGNKKFWDITFLDGTVYDFQETPSKTSWKFLHEGVPVLECSLVERNGKKYLEYSLAEGGSEKLEIVKIASQIRGVDLIRVMQMRGVGIMAVFSGVL